MADPRYDFGCSQTHEQENQVESPRKDQRGAFSNPDLQLDLNNPKILDQNLAASCKNKRQTKALVKEDKLVSKSERDRLPSPD